MIQNEWLTDRYKQQKVFLRFIYNNFFVYLAFFDSGKIISYFFYLGSLIFLFYFFSMDNSTEENVKTEKILEYYIPKDSTQQLKLSLYIKVIVIFSLNFSKNTQIMMEEMC